MTSESTTQRDRFRRRGAAFTLVELLAVVGIIALLLAILLPTLRRAREAAKAVQCLSNVRQLSGAVIMWAQEHQGYTPSGADWTPRRYDPVTRKFSTIGPPDTNPQFKEPSDWIAWMRALDPYTLRPNSVPSQNVTYSALTRYLGFRRKDHATDAEANRINPILDAVFRCPSDNLAQRNSGADDSHSIYRYSYSLNANYTNPTPARGRAVVDGRFSGRISSIRNASEKVMFICEDEKTLNHGTFQASADRFLTGGFTHLVASRHESKIRKATNINDSRREGNENARGNVGFCDGHAEFFSRKDACFAPSILEMRSLIPLASSGSRRNLLLVKCNAMKPAQSAGKDLVASMAAAHCIASYVVMIAWVLLVRPREDRLIWAVFVIGAPLATPFFVILAWIFGVARSDQRAVGFAITYAAVFTTATIAIYRRRRSAPAKAEGVAPTPSLP